MLIAWCMGVTLEMTMQPGWQNGRSRSETRKGQSGRASYSRVVLFRRKRRCPREPCDQPFVVQLKTSCRLDTSSPAPGRSQGPHQTQKAVGPHGPAQASPAPQRYGASQSAPKPKRSPEQPRSNHSGRLFEAQLAGASTAEINRTGKKARPSSDELSSNITVVGRDCRRGQLVRRPVGYTGRKRGVRHRRSADRVRHVDRQRIPQHVLRSGVRASVHHEGARVASARRNHACFRICQ